MITFEQFGKIVNSFEFSISGYQDIDDYFVRFLDEMSRKRVLFDSENIVFFSFAYSELLNVEQWKLKDTSKNFVFLPFRDIKGECVKINEYYAFKDYLKDIKTSSKEALGEEEYNLISSSKSSQLSAIIFKEPISYRVRVSDLNSIEVSYCTKKRLLTVLVPITYLVRDSERLKKMIESEADTNLKFPLVLNRRIFAYEETDGTYSCFNDFDECALSDYITELTDKLISLNTEYDIFEAFENLYIQKCHVEGFVKLLFTHSYLSYLFDCWIESTPSIVNIDRLHGNKKHSLGIVIWGYDEIETEWRHVFELISNRICSNFAVHYLIPLFTERIKNETIKSAKAAIMSRNMSHNLGSHVMAYIKQQLASVSDIVRTHVLDDLCTLPDLKQLQLYTESVEMPFLVGLSRFLNYLQERQDYIATISTDYIPALSTISFKDFIYDELKPDLRYERHHEVSDPKGRKPKNLLLDYIAYSEGYKDSKAIELCFGDFFGKNPAGVNKVRQQKSFADLRKLEVALPGGIIGRQALFSIIENIIRNAAKHSYPNKNHTLKISIDELVLNEGEERKQLEGFCYAFKTVRNSVPELCYLEDNKIELKRITDSHLHYHFITITNCLENDLEQVQKVQRSVYTPYINDVDGKMNSDCKGIKEIRLSAAWIRGFQLDIDIKDEPDAIYVRAVDPLTLQPTKKIQKVAVQYLIFVPKPRRVAIITDKIIKSMKGLEHLNNKGCMIFPSKASVGLYNDYEIIVIDTEIVKHIHERFLTARVLKMRSEEIEKMINETDEESIERNISDLHKALFNLKFPEKMDTKVVIFDGKVSDESWVNHKELDKKFIYYGTPSSNESDFSHNVVYSTHYEGLEKEKSRGDKGCDEKCIRMAASIEGISGNNSTDRLVRKNQKNEEWFYRHLLAGLTRIVIFDERMFDYVAPTTKRIELLKDVSDFLDGVSEDAYRVVFKLMDYVSSRSGGLYRGKEARDIQKLIYRYRETKGKEDLAHLQTIVSEINNSILDSFDTTLLKKYFEKRIHFFNFQFNSYKREVQIWGYTAPIKYASASYTSVDKINILGRIYMENNDYKLEFFHNEKSSPYNVFDFILIHQGLLDKIYNMFEIGDSDVVEKHKITRLLFNHFARLENLDKVVPYVDERGAQGDYLPQFIIHSGRSKPEYKDMPQQQPFIPFAAMENAVKDCKYTLSELLYSNHYEPKNKK